MWKIKISFLPSHVCRAGLNTTYDSWHNLWHKLGLWAGSWDQILFLFALPSFLSCDSSLAAGSYVALTVLGRPPYIPLEEEEDEEEGKKEEGAEVSSPFSLSVLHSPALPAGERCSHETSRASCSPQDPTTTCLPDGVRMKIRPNVWMWPSTCLCTHLKIKGEHE